MFTTDGGNWTLAVFCEPDDGRHGNDPRGLRGATQGRSELMEILRAAQTRPMAEAGYDLQGHLADCPRRTVD